MQARAVMALSDFIGPFIIAVIIHALVFSSGMMNHDAKIVPQKGASSVTLNMVTSVAPRASKVALRDDVPNVSRRDIKAGTEEAVRPVSEPPHTPSVKKPPASNRSARANTVAPAADATPRHDERVLSDENIAGQEEPETGQHVRIEEDVTESPLMLQKPTPVYARGTGDNEGEVREQGVRVPASAVGLSKPAYPRFSRIYGEEGTVVLSVEVLADGRPGKIEIVSSSGYRRLDRAALKAIGRARFIAGKVDGRAVDSTQRIAFRFDLYEPGGRASRAKP